MEIWKEVKNYEGLYQISNIGRVKSLSRKKVVKGIGSYITKERILKYPMINYPHVTLSNSNGIKKTELIHRLIAIAFIPNPENKPEVNHKNSNPKDFRIENLEWVTKSENEIHSWKFGSKKARLGEDNEQCKLSDLQVIEIRNKYKLGGISQRKLASEYGVSQCRINFIINNKARCA